MYVCVVHVNVIIGERNETASWFQLEKFLYGFSALFGCYWIHLNLHVLGWIEVDMWIDANLTSKQGLTLRTYPCNNYTNIFEDSVVLVRHL
jgi:hypothetical protein